MKRKAACREIIENLLKRGKASESDLDKIFREISKRHGLNETPNKVEILSHCTEKEYDILKKLLMTKPSRSVSGVSVITVVAKPFPCPGKCIYCPKGKNAPQSYTGMEPAIQRGIRNDYDPFLQTKDRLNQYKLTGHPSDKIEVIVLGGTFPAVEENYQKYFIKRIFEALNDTESESLGEAKRINETGKHRCVGLTIETRPDFCFENHINQMLELGTTRVEIGVQSIYDSVLKKIKRGHTVLDTIKATQLSKDSCLKCTYHVMPGLFVGQRKDLEQFKILFKDENFRPDSLKIYPALVIEGTELFDLWKNGKYKPLEEKESIRLISEAMKHIPKYCRVIRVQRDIPSDRIVAGVKKSNLRELVERECERKKVRIQEIRYREVGHKMNKGVAPEKIELCRMDYDASGGKEVFLSFEDSRNDILFGFLRLRIPGKPFRKEIDKKTGLIREIHIYGSTLPLGKRESESWQHKGLGKQLLQEAERIAKEEFEMKKLIVISGIGVREYYRKFGFKVEGPYMAKEI